MSLVRPRVLLVEDDRYLRRACMASLQRRGFDVLVADNGLDGLAMAKAERPALVLLDMLMPKMTGLEMLRAMRADAATRDVPVLILSNSSRESDLDEVNGLGIVGYLVKANLSLRELGDRVATLLGGNG